MALWRFCIAGIGVLLLALLLRAQFLWHPLLPVVESSRGIGQSVPTGIKLFLPLAHKPGTGITQLNTGVLGFSDVMTHQVVRNSSDRVYLFVPEIYRTYLRALRATSTGTPTSFTEADAAHRPNAAAPIWSVDAAIDAGNVVHLLYIVESGPIVYQTFDTRTDRWGPAIQIVNAPWPNRNNDIRQGSAGVALALDRSGTAHILYSKTANSLRRLYYNHNSGGSWSHESLLDDQPGSDNSHPTLAFAPDGSLYAAWLADNGSQGAIRVRARRNGSWGSGVLVDSNVYRNQGYSIDQGPSMLVTPNGHIHLAYVGPYERVANSPSGYEYGRLHHRVSIDRGATWVTDPPPLRYTHNPALATDLQGNLYIFGHAEPWKADDCASMLVTVRPAGAGWRGWATLDSGCFDSSVSVKWAQYHWHNPAVLDLIYWTQKGSNGEPDNNELHYVELRGGPSVVDTLSSAAEP